MVRLYCPANNCDRESCAASKRTHLQPRLTFEDVVSAGYCCEHSVPGCWHGVTRSRVLQRPPLLTMVRLYSWPPETVVVDQVQTHHCRVPSVPIRQR